MKNIETSSRRDFLFAAGFGAAAAATAIGTQPREPVAPIEAAPERSQGYRASPHVLKYYRTTEA